MGCPVIPIFPGSALPGQIDRFTGHFHFGEFALLGDLLHDVTVSITGGKIHPVIDSRRILPQGLFNGTHFIDELAPVHGVQESETSDAVADGKLVRRLLLILRLNHLADSLEGL